MEALDDILARRTYEDLEEEDCGPCGYVRECMTLRMHDGNLIPLLNIHPVRRCDPINQSGGRQAGRHGGGR